jgi:hypothetical protein
MNGIKTRRPAIERSLCKEREGFEPSETCAPLVFKTSAFDHSAIFPKYHCAAHSPLSGVRSCTPHAWRHQPTFNSLQTLKMREVGFEPTHPKNLIYSQVRLSNFAALSRHHCCLASISVEAARSSCVVTPAYFHLILDIENGGYRGRTDDLLLAKQMLSPIELIPQKKS